jgi:esterase
MDRHQFQHRGLTFSYLDAGGDGRVLVALHAHWMEGVTYARLAAALAPAWRVVALDQRGHGDSDHAPTYTRDDYIGDVEACFDHLVDHFFDHLGDHIGDHVGLADAVVLGNSLGGVNAYQFAARHPERVRALVVEDIGAVVADDTSFALAWGGTFATRELLAERVGPRFLPYLQDSFRETPDGWLLAFDPRDTVASQGLLNGDHWADWLATDAPALLIRGRASRVTTAEAVEQMTARRPNTRLITLDGGHVVHVDNPAGFSDVVQTFLQSL